MKIAYISPFKDCSGYAEAARNYLSALHKVGANVVARHIKFDNLNHKLTELQNKLMNSSLKDVDVVLQHTTPNTSMIKKGVTNILYMAWETTMLPKSWPQIINKFDAVMVPCEENVKALKASGVTIPVFKVPHAFDLDKYNKEGPPLINMDNIKGNFIFYNICQLSKKKGIDRLLIAYLTEFKAEEPVALFLKTYINANFGQDDTKKAAEYVIKIKEALKLDSYPKIFLNVQILSDEQIIDMHKAFDCMVAPSRAEGFCIPAFEAIASGTPTIVTNWGGFKEYSEGCLGVDYKLEPVIGMNHRDREMYIGRELWAVVDIMDLREAMREVYQSSDLREELSKKAKATSLDFSHEKIGKMMLDIIEKVHNEKQAN